MTPDGLGWVVGTYLPLLMVPGPNLLLVGAAVALGGPRLAAAAVLGVAAGAAALCVLVLATLEAASGTAPAWLAAARLGGAFALLWFALRLLRRQAVAGPSPCTAGPAGCAALFVAGFWTAATNPVTAAFVAGQALGPLAEQAAARAWLPWIIAGMALTWLGLAAALMARPACLRLVIARQRALRLVAAAVLAWSALDVLAPLLPDLRPSFAISPPRADLAGDPVLY
jgi:threonine/homoserine/homoserine lactone efflux protein